MAQAWDHLLVKGAEVRHKQDRLVCHHICGPRSSHCNEERVLGGLTCFIEVSEKAPVLQGINTLIF